MLRLLLRPRWIALVAVLLLFVLPGCYLLGQWQVDRYEARRERNAQARANLSAPAVEVDELVAVGEAVPSRYV